LQKKKKTFPAAKDPPGANPPVQCVLKFLKLPSWIGGKDAASADGGETGKIFLKSAISFCNRSAGWFSHLIALIFIIINRSTIKRLVFILGLHEKIKPAVFSLFSAPLRPSQPPA
jgi:hypothetical protein